MTRTRNTPRGIARRSSLYLLMVVVGLTVFGGMLSACSKSRRDMRQEVRQETRVEERTEDRMERRRGD